MRDPFSVKGQLSDEAESLEDGSGLDFEEGFTDLTGPARLDRIVQIHVSLKLLWFLLFISFVLLFGRLYFLTVVKYAYFSNVSQGNHLRIEYLPAPRGAIYDSAGEVISGNKPGFELVASPIDLPKDKAELDNLVKRVSQTLGIPDAEIQTVLDTSNRQTPESVLIKQNLSRDQALVFNEREVEFPGFRVVSTPIRDYKSPFAYAHLVGYTGKITTEEYQQKATQGYRLNDSLGKTGLEQSYEEYLRGKFGQRQVEVDARGTIKKTYGEKPATPGNNLYLNVDAGLQEKLYEALVAQLRAVGKKRAAGIAMDPRNGKILALVSFPGFDINQFAEGISPNDYRKLIEDKNLPLFNRALSGTYPPGSTVKPMVATAALAEHVITESTIIDDRGYIVVPNIYGGPDYFFYGYRHTGLGKVDVRRALAVSSDIFFYTVGGGDSGIRFFGLGIEKLAEYYRRFKIDQVLGIDLPEEQAGLVPTPEWRQQRFADDPVASRWYLGNTYHVSIGQGDLLATPLSVLSWISTIANGGQIFQPYLVNRITDGEGKTIRELAPRVIGELGVDKNILEVVRDGLRQTVESGTARLLNTLPISVSGKTGTAQFDAKNLARAHAWFVAYAPSTNPEIAIVVLIEDGGEGSSVSVPVVRDVLDWWAKNRYNKINS